MRVFQWRAQVWFPSNYVVSRTFQGESEVIPTVLASSPTCITTPRTDPNHPVYLLEKQVRVERKRVKTVSIVKIKKKKEKRNSFILFHLFYFFLEYKFLKVFAFT